MSRGAPFAGDGAERDEGGAVLFSMCDPCPEHRQELRQPGGMRGPGRRRGRMPHGPVEHAPGVSHRLAPEFGMTHTGHPQEGGEVRHLVPACVDLVVQLRDQLVGRHPLVVRKLRQRVPEQVLELDAGPCRPGRNRPRRWPCPGGRARCAPPDTGPAGRAGRWLPPWGFRYTGSTTWPSPCSPGNRSPAGYRRLAISSRSRALFLSSTRASSAQVLEGASAASSVPADRVPARTTVPFSRWVSWNPNASR